MSKQKINWSKQYMYDVKEGLHLCEVVTMYDPKENNRSCETMSKILLAPVGQTNPLKLSVVAKEYCTDAPNDSLREDLNTILDGRLEEYVDADGAFDYRSVEGRKVVAVVRNIRGKNHENPYSFVTDILPQDALKFS